MGSGIWRLGTWALCALFAAVLPYGVLGQASPTQPEGERGMPLADRAKPAGWSVAFNYAKDAPLDELKLFDVVVVEPDHGHDPAAHRARSAGQSELYAYLSMGEVHPTRTYFKTLPTGLLKAVNPDWSSHVIDQTHPQWVDVLISTMVAPMWAKGYRGFFLDTLDSYRLLSTDSQQQLIQQQALESAIEALHGKFPGIRLIANRGFEMLPRLHHRFEAVAAESVLEGWHAASQSYVAVPPSDRQWLLDRLNETRERYGLPVIAIDYVAAHDREKTRATAGQLRQLGLIPWVSDAKLETLGMGLWEVLPRRVLVVQENSEKLDISGTEVSQNLLMPLQHLGLVPEVVEWDSKNLEPRLLRDRYAGVVVWNRSVNTALSAQAQRFYHAVLDQAVPLVVLKSLGVEPDAALLRRFGLARSNYRPVLGQTALSKASWVGFERQALADDTASLRLLNEQQSRLRFRDTRGAVVDPVGITPWGGYALAPYVVFDLGMAEQRRWVIDPLEFLRQALQLKDLPVPDLTTAGGRRMAFVHIDGDGFASRAELPRAPFAAQIMLDRFIKKYPLPHTVSVIEAEVAGHGLFAALSPALVEIARSIFALDHVEIASHSFSHPLRWIAMTNGSEELGKGASLPVPGYRFDLKREIAGSQQYIDSQLAPQGKQTRMFLWTGDCIPPAQALSLAAASGLMTMNGGDTIITRSYPSWTAISGHYLKREGQLQVFAPIQSEMLYTNLWSGPFHGFKRVIETFEMTERPHRFKPINLYYHTYSASKPAAIAALDTVYNWIMAQPIFPLYASEFSAATHDFDRLAMGRRVGDGPQTLRIASAGILQSLRWNEAGVRQIDWQGSDALAGAALHPHNADQAYLHLSNARVSIAMQAGSTAQPEPPHIASSNARIAGWQREGKHLRFQLQGLMPVEFSLAGAKGCEVSANGKRLSALQRPSHPQDAKPLGPAYSYFLPRSKANGITESSLVSVRC